MEVNAKMDARPGGIGRFSCGVDFPQDGACTHSAWPADARLVSERSRRHRRLRCLRSGDILEPRRTSQQQGYPESVRGRLKKAVARCSWRRLFSRRFASPGCRRPRRPVCRAGHRSCGGRLCGRFQSGRTRARTYWRPTDGEMVSKMQSCPAPRLTKKVIIGAGPHYGTTAGVASDSQPGTSPNEVNASVKD